jgi:hypothetical protein
VRGFPELQAVESLTKKRDSLVSSEVIAEVAVKGRLFPIIAIKIGGGDDLSPCLGLFGGVHGLERVGSQVVISYLNSMIHQLGWDRDLRKVMKRMRILAIPIVNPGGMFASTRCNPQGVDLMRNSPIEADIKATTFLVSGHRISNLLPWFRGQENDPMEIESQAVVDFAIRHFLPARISLALDLHSGFGLRDRLWYPYAKSADEFPMIGKVKELHSLLNLSIPHHVYKVERQTDAYTISGDLWDHICLIQKNTELWRDNIFIPWTLEMGSWTWLKKNPIQFFTRRGYFNPMKIHRQSRIMRRHIPLIDFFRRAVSNARAWT